MRSQGLCSAALAALLLIGGAKAHADGGAAALNTDPEDGAVHDGVYENPYFGLTMPLPPSWVQALKGPPVSHTGYYVLATFTPAETLTATFLIAAQDLFFAVKPAADAAEAVERFAATLGGASGLSVVQAPRQVTVSGQAFTRLDYEGAGLYHVLLATDRRCHVVSFVLTSPDPATLDVLVAGLGAMHWTVSESDAVPLCLEALPEAARHARALAGVLGGAPARVRLIIGADGKVQHVHAIGASANVAEMLSLVLSRWNFDPYRQAGEPVAIETGVVIGARDQPRSN